MLYSVEVPAPTPPDRFYEGTVAIHEFGHWLVLGHISSWRPWNMVMTTQRVVMTKLALSRSTAPINRSRKRRRLHNDNPQA